MGALGELNANRVLIERVAKGGFWSVESECGVDSKCNKGALGPRRQLRVRRERRERYIQIEH